MDNLEEFGKLSVVLAQKHDQEAVLYLLVSYLQIHHHHFLSSWQGLLR